MLETCPCKDCQKRTFDCHGKCVKYLAWKKQNDAIRLKIQQKKHDNIVALETELNRKIKKKVS